MNFKKLSIIAFKLIKVMHSGLVSVGSTVQVTTNNASWLGLVISLTDTTFSMERLAPTVSTIMDVRLISVPHVQHILGSPVVVTRNGINAPTIEPILVVNTIHFLSNAIVYRVGMTGVYAIESRKESANTIVSTPIGPTEFHYCTNNNNNTTSNSADLLSQLLMQPTMTLDYLFQFYVFRHTLVDHFQRLLRSSRGRRVTSSFAFNASMENAYALLQVLARSGSVINRHSGLHRATRVLRTNSVQALRIPKDSLSVNVGDPTLLCPLLGRCTFC